MDNKELIDTLADKVKILDLNQMIQNKDIHQKDIEDLKNIFMTIVDFSDLYVSGRIDTLYSDYDISIKITKKF